MDDKFVFPLLRLPFESMTEVDLSIENAERLGINLSNNEILQEYLTTCANESGAWVLWGGYLEKRNLYQGAPNFEGEEARDIHLGLDFWVPAETAVYAPWDGVVHAIQDNAGFKNYGPTLILRHTVHGADVYALFGHLTEASLRIHEVGQTVEQGNLIGWVGAEHENGNWPPHLHFQLIHDLEHWQGDYPGVCAPSTLEKYKQNCPDPSLLLGL